MGSLADKYVIIDYTSKFSDSYSLASDYVSPWGYGITTYFALDKNYFESHGGINGLFSIGSDEYKSMSPKDSKDLNDHSYTFIISKNEYCRYGRKCQ